MVVFCLDMVREIRDDFRSLMFLTSHREHILRCDANYAVNIVISFLIFVEYW